MINDLIVDLFFVYVFAVILIIGLGITHFVVKFLQRDQRRMMAEIETYNYPDGYAWHETQTIMGTIWTATTSPTIDFSCSCGCECEAECDGKEQDDG